MSPTKKIKVKSIKYINNGIIKPFTLKDWFKVCFTLILLFGILAVILLGGPALSRYLEESDRKAIDKNGAIVKAVIYRKHSHKGRTVYFKYLYKGIEYNASEGGFDLYDNLNIIDTVVIKIDTLDPENAYILEY
jgi:hypothetical protein